MRHLSALISSNQYIVFDSARFLNKTLMLLSIKALHIHYFNYKKEKAIFLIYHQYFGQIRKKIVFLIEQNPIVSLLLALNETIKLGENKFTQ